MRKMVHHANPSKATRLIPHDTELEQGTIGALLVIPSLIGEAISLLRMEDFHEPLYRAVFAKMVERYAEGGVIDLQTLAVSIASQFPGVDVRQALLDALDTESVPTRAAVGQYCRLLSEMGRKRRLIQIAREIAEVGYDETPAGEAVGRALGLVLDAAKGREVGAYVPIARVMDSAGDAITLAMENPRAILGLDSGLSSINAVLGGLQATNLITIAGRPSMGKSSLASTLALNVAKGGHKVAFNSLEMGEKRLVLRLVSSLTGVPAVKIRRGQLEAKQKAKVYDCLTDLRLLPLSLDCRTNVTSAQIAAKARELAASKGLDLLIVDYLGLLADRDDSEVRRLGTITRTLKALAVDLEIPVIALHQLSRHLEHRRDKVPTLSDLRGSGRVEEDSDIVLFVHRDDYYKGEAEVKAEVSICDLVLRKNRDGPTGKFQVAFRRPTLTFYDLEVRDGNDRNSR